MKKEAIKRFVNRIYPILILVVSLFFALLCINYRERDWITGGLLLAIFIPVFFFQILFAFGIYFSEKGVYKNLFIVLESLITILVVIFSLIYIIKYN